MRPSFLVDKDTLFSSNVMCDYQSKEKSMNEYEYAKDISFDDTCNAIQTILDAILSDSGT